MYRDRGYKYWWRVTLARPKIRKNQDGINRSSQVINANTKEEAINFARNFIRKDHPTENTNDWVVVSVERSK